MQEGSSQDRRLVRTSTPGVYKRGDRYVVRYRDPQGPQTLRPHPRRGSDAARTLTVDISRGEFRQASKVTFADYLPTRLSTYTGRTSKGIRAETLAEYRLTLDRDALPFFGRTPLAAIEPRTIKSYAAHIAGRGRTCRSCDHWAADDPRRPCRTCGGKGRLPGAVSANTVRLALAPVKALLATAF